MLNKIFTLCKACKLHAPTQPRPVVARGFHATAPRQVVAIDVNGDPSVPLIDSDTANDNQHEVAVLPGGAEEEVIDPCYKCVLYRLLHMLFLNV